MNDLKVLFADIGLKLVPNLNGREGVDYFIENNQIYLKSIDLDTTERSIKNFQTRVRRIKC